MFADFFFNIFLKWLQCLLPPCLFLFVSFSASFRLSSSLFHLQLSIGTFAFIKSDMQSFIQPSLFWQPKLTKNLVRQSVSRFPIFHFPFPISHFQFSTRHFAGLLACPICIIYLLIYLLRATRRDVAGTESLESQSKLGRNWNWNSNTNTNTNTSSKRKRKKKTKTKAKTSTNTHN